MWLWISLGSMENFCGKLLMLSTYYTKNPFADKEKRAGTVYVKYVQ